MPALQRGRRCLISLSSKPATAKRRRRVFTKGLDMRNGTMPDLMNTQMVGAGGDDIVVMMPKNKMTREEALVHAAWIVAIADRNGDFKTILDAVMNT